MKTVKVVTTFFCILIFANQACVSNKSFTASESKIESVVVQTHDGYTYDLPWFEVKDGELISILNTARIVLNKDQVIEVVINNPETNKANIDDALIHDGTISMIAFDAGQRVHHYKFYELVEVRGQIVGYTYTGDHSANVAIPMENVKNIDVKKIKQTNDSINYPIGWAFFIVLDCLAAFYTYPPFF